MNVWQYFLSTAEKEDVEIDQNGKKEELKILHSFYIVVKKKMK